MSHHPDAFGPGPDHAPGPGTPEPLIPLEARLRGWAPAPAADPSARDRLLFEAGRAAAAPAPAPASDHRLVAYRLAASVLALACLALGGQLARERTTQARLLAERSALVARLEASRGARTPLAPAAAGGARLARLDTGPPAASSYLVLSRHPETLGARPSTEAVPPSPPDPDATHELTPLRARSNAAWLDL